MKTYSAKKTDVVRKWWIVDAEGKTLGRVATEVARVLIGKHKPMFTPHIDTGDFVVIVNAEKIGVTGAKETDKKYFKHTGYVGSWGYTSVEEMRNKKPKALLEHAVSGMLPKNKMRARRMKRLKLIIGTEHNHQAQMPEEMKI